MELEDGARDWNRTSDLLLTKEVLYRLSYTGVNGNFLSRYYQAGAGSGNRTRVLSLEG